MKALINCACPGCDIVHKEDNADAIIIMRHMGASNWELKTYVGSLDFPFSYLLCVRLPDDTDGPVLSLTVYPATAAHLYQEISDISNNLLDIGIKHQCKEHKQ